MYVCHLCIKELLTYLFQKPYIQIERYKVSLVISRELTQVAG